jgi:PKD repeat protein
MLVDANGNGFGLYFGANGYLVPGDVTGGIVREGTYVAHAIPGYVRFRKSGANYVVDTSPDGTTWTAQRSAPLVANTATGAMKLQFTASGYGTSGSWSASYDDITWAGSSVAPAPPPVARMSTSCSALSCNYDGSASTASTGASYTWAFGDGTTGSGVTASHAYATAGSYTATLTVTDANGANSTSQSVAVSSVTAQLTESWSSNTIGSNWVYTHSGAGAASAASGALTLGSNAAGDATATVTTASAYSLDAAGSTGVVFKLASTATTRDNTALLVDANGNGFGFYFGPNGYLVIGDVTGGLVREGTYVRNVIPGFVRFRMSGTNYVVDTSPDGTTWTVQRSSPLVASTVTGAMKLQFTASGYGTTGSWSASYDDITWK